MISLARLKAEPPPIDLSDGERMGGWPHPRERAFRFRSPRRTLFYYGVALGLSMALWIVAGQLFLVTSPSFAGGTAEFPNQSTQTFRDPFFLNKVPRSKFILRETLILPRFHPNAFTFLPQDILWSIKVNSHPIQASELPIAIEQNEGHSVNLAPYLHPGKNQIELGMEDLWKTTSLRIEVSPWDTCSLAILALVLLAIASTLLTVCWMFSINLSWVEISLFYGAIALQAVYLLGTPYFLRAYDMDGHVEYIRYVAQTFKLPGPHAGWETYQPPLYYLVVGGLTRLAQILGLAGHQLLIVCQWFSWLCTVGCLSTAVWMSRELYKGEENRESRLYFLGIVAVFPSLIFNASRISNDVLLNFLAFFWLAWLIHFWKRPAWSSWLGISFTLALALLTKANALPLVMLSFMCLAFAPQLNFRPRLSWGTLTTLICACVAGWYYFPRLFHETGADSYLVGNIHVLNPKGRIDGIFFKSLVFNPFKVLRYPFVFPWGDRHEYFLEYYFKSAFLGEWWLSESYKWIARFFVSFALLLFPFLIVGLTRCIRGDWIKSLPLSGTLVGLFLFQWGFVQIAPFMSSQDFRYAVILVVPIAYFIVEGLNSLNQKWRPCASWGLRILMINCVVYLIASSLFN